MHLQKLPKPPERDPATLADPGRLLGEFFQAYPPPAAGSVADFTAEHRWLSNEGGGYVGRWSHATAPYLVEPMEALTDPRYLTVAIVKPGQCGGTSVAENWLLYSVCAAPADFLWYMPTEPLVTNYVKTRINPMVDAHRGMRERRGRAPSDNSLGFKGFGAMSVQFLATIHPNLISKSAPRIVVDEIDAAAASLGDVMALVNVRRQTFGRESKVLVASHPDRAAGPRPKDWTQGVMALYADSTRATWWWPCPHCGAYSSPNPGAPRHMRLDYPEAAPLDAIEAEARLVCPVNGCLIEDDHRRAMNLMGRWIGDGEEIDEAGEISGGRTRRDTAGFWIVGVMSPFVLGGIGGLARARVKAEREFAASADDGGLRTVMVKSWGIPYQPPRDVAQADAAVLAERADAALRLGQVPEGARFLTCAVDVQANRFEYLVRGWGEAGRSWIVDAGRIVADPAASAEDWDKLFEWMLDLAYPLAGSGSPPSPGVPARTLRVRASGFDTGGLAGVTQQAYAAWRRFRANKRVRFLGAVGGRDVYTVMALKGLSGPNAAALNVVYPDHKRKDRSARAAGTIPLALFNTNAAKDDVAGQLAVADGGPWAVHFPTGLRPADTEGPGAFFEQLCAEARGKDGRWAKVASAARNEAWDLMVMTSVLARLHGLARIDWSRPPPWAKPPGEGNTLIEQRAPQPPTAIPAKAGIDATAARIAARITATVPRTGSGPGSAGTGLKVNLARMG